MNKGAGWGRGEKSNENEGKMRLWMEQRMNGKLDQHLYSADCLPSAA